MYLETVCAIISTVFVLGVVVGLFVTAYQIEQEEKRRERMLNAILDDNNLCVGLGDDGLDSIGRDVHVAVGEKEQ